MKISLFKTVKNKLVNWKIPLLLGIVFIVIGTKLIIAPLESYTTISLVFGFSILIAGVLEIWHGVSLPKENESSIWYVLGGIIGLYVGVLLVLNTELTMLFLPYYFGFWLFFRAVLVLGTALELRTRHMAGWMSFMLLGLVGLVLSTLILINPIYGSLGIVYLSALTFVFLGVFNVLLAYNLKK